jgi:V/A-type H+/Na+-transporting ATPase subunit E
MAYENLLKSVEENAEEKEEELREKARIAIREISEGTKNEVLMIQQSLLAEANKAAMIEKNKRIYITKNQNKEDLIRTKESIFSIAFSEAEKNLLELRNDPEYPHIFTKLVKETVGALGGEKFRIHVDKRDEPLVKKVISELDLHCDIIPDLKSAGGLVASSLDESVKISNTFESRIERAKEQKKLEIYSLLFGD